MRIKTEFPEIRTGSVAYAMLRDMKCTSINYEPIHGHAVHPDIVDGQAWLFLDAWALVFLGINATDRYTSVFLRDLGTVNDAILRGSWVPRIYSGTDPAIFIFTEMNIDRIRKVDIRTRQLIEQGVLTVDNSYDDLKTNDD